MKKHKNKELPSARERLLLEGKHYSKEDLFGEEKNLRNFKNIKRATAAYFITFILTLLILSALIFSGSLSNYALTSKSFWGRGAEKLASFLSSGEFFQHDLDIDDHTADGGNGNLNSDSSFVPVYKPNADGNEGNARDPEGADKLTDEELYSFNYEMVKSGETAIVPMDLSLSGYGAHYINNSTGYSPDTAKLLSASLEQTIDFDYLSTTGSPLVLIIHTHATEAYSEEGAISYYDDGGEYARSKNKAENVVAVGKALADELNRLGIATVHSEKLHDELQYKDSYSRAEETIKSYIEKYPTIRLVIDLHRDAVVKSNGDIVRPVAIADGEAAAQIMCVVGSDYGGEACPNWERNLSLALKLREMLNGEYGNICRPPYLRSSTYNQEIAPYSLLLEIGASGNSLSEAKRSAIIVAEALAELIKQL